MRIKPSKDMRIKPSKIGGEVNAPPSKSMMQRAAIAAGLAEGKSLITNPSLCDDAIATLGVVEVLGAKVYFSPGRSEEIRIAGRRQPSGNTLDCRESGTCMRMISAVAALQSKEYIITGKGSLMKRPVGMVAEPLRALGARCSTNNGMPPIKVKGPIQGKKLEVDGSKTSQFVSGLLMALPLCSQDSELRVLNLKSRSYVDMTLSVLSAFGIKINRDKDTFNITGGQQYQSTNYAIEGDWSGAAFMLVAGAIAGEVAVKGLRWDSNQPDKAILSVLSKVGADVSKKKESVIVRKREMMPFEYNAINSPDLFPPLAVLACSCKGTSIIYGVERIRHKESDRAAALVEELGKMGADIKVVGNRMEIKGKRLCGGKVSSHNDHRIAMACAVAALNSENGAIINGADCLSKSYPKFFEDLHGLMIEG